MANLPVAMFFAQESMRQEFGWDEEPSWRRDPRILRQQRAEEQLKRVENEQQVLREALRGVRRPSRRQLAAAGMGRRWFGGGWWSRRSAQQPERVPATASSSCG